MPIRIVLVLIAFLFCGPFWTVASAGYVHPEILISTEELAGLLDKPNVRVVDAVSNASMFDRAHIPNAVSIPHPTIADLKSRREIGYPVPVETAEQVFGGIGIDESTAVVVYDEGAGPSATALWFALKFFGHDNVKILNGGFRKWLAEGRPVTQTAVQPEAKTFKAKPREEMVVTSQWVVDHLKDPNTVIIDTRSLNEYIGKNKLNNPRGGHVPGAKLLEWTEVSGESETFKLADQLKELFEKNGLTKDKNLVTYCQIGMGRATDLYVALSLLGYTNIKTYTGSWQDWSSNPTLEGEL